MSIDFSRLSSVSPSSEATEPRRIFAALPSKSTKYAYPRDVQAEVWDQWHQRRNEPDLLVKMNTGSGKTVVGLLILQSSLNEGVGPCVYVAADNYLLEQVQRDAEELGLSVTDDITSSQFRNNRSILAVNIHRLVNGRSVFGTTSTGVRINIGTLLVDDIHACLTRVEEQFTLRIPRHHPTYEALLQQFEHELERQSLHRYRSICDGDTSHVMQVPFWAWTSNLARVVEVLNPHRDDDEFRFIWPLVSDNLHLCRVGFGAHQIQIGLPLPTIDTIPTIRRAHRRIYMTGTFPDTTILVTHFSADPTSVSRPITPSTASDIGDRMILTPHDTHPQSNESELRDILFEFANEHNVVVIVPSHRRALEWRELGARVYDKATISDGVTALKSGHVGLVVLVNKYDGIDLPEDACRILAIDGLPETSEELERLEELALSDTSIFLTRQIQRIEQGMGRGIRSNEDWCVVLLMGWRLTERLYSGGATELFSPATRAQLELSQSLADQLREHPISELVDVISKCLERDPAWVAASRSARDGIAFDAQQEVSKLGIALRHALDRAAIGQYENAVDSIKSTISETLNSRLRGWLKFTAASYLHHTDEVDAQQLLASAVEDNTAIIRPVAGVAYERISGHADQARRCSELMTELYSGPVEALLGFTSILDDLVPHPERAEEFEEAWHQIGLHLGFASDRPERDQGNGPDVLWLTGRNRALIVECKSGSSSEFIYRRDAAQVAHSVDWFLERYDSSSLSPVGVLIHNSNRLHHDASAREGTRVITFEKLGELRGRILQFAQTICTADKWQDPNSVGERLLHSKLTAGQFLGNWTIPTRRSRAPKD